jgi:feruloyl esterase
MADGLVSTKNSLLYYKNTQDAMPGVTLQDFFRYYQVPGMQHCFGTDQDVNAPWMFAGAGQANLLQATYSFGPGWSVPGFLNDSRYDALTALMDWVEKTRPLTRSWQLLRILQAFIGSGLYVLIH